MISVGFYKNNRLRLGVKTNKGILDVEAASIKFPYIKNVPKSVNELISLGEQAKQGLMKLNWLEL
ncbi:hypothetical protein J2S10_002320 [Neobacillus ginsengisoli]|uniref:Uncharacterized protein n=1 Tax=Neobacillus ginsengisoli TaxID=904295 RepID=A0ABT9XUC4_9BACI|nr:hypothetical protein [Neobacillus ginsengisoli]MDQ0199162.1 hypothetical protein [Neobacillus ginsengisoli]